MITGDSEDRELFIRITPEQKLKKLNIVQKFRDSSDNYCLINVLLSWVLDMPETAQRNGEHIKNTKKINYIEKINKLKEEYSQGVPEDKLKYICDDFAINIQIQFPFMHMNTTNVICKQKKAQKTFTFTNTRVNHVDQGSFTCGTSNVETLEHGLGDAIIAKLDEAKKPYIFTKSANSITEINTPEMKYKFVNYRETEIILQIEESYPFLKYGRFDLMKNPALRKFVKLGTHYNCSVTLKERTFSNNIKHIDMRTAYNSYDKCNFYNGFLAVITDF